MNGCRLYLRYASAAMRSEMEYRASFAMMAAGRCIVALSGFVGLRFLFSGFEQIGGYTYADVLLCYAVMELSFAIAACISRGFGAFSGMIKRGEFDIVLIRPRSAILQVLGSRFEIQFIGPMLSALGVLGWAVKLQRIGFTPMRLLTLALMVAGGTMLFTGLFMAGAAICFFSIEDSSALNVLTYGGRDHGKYPIDIYGKGLFRFCTYVIPYTLVQYYPLQYLTGRSECALYGLYPLGVSVFLLVCWAFWRVGVRHYTSTGS